ncbi:MAG: polysaccharide deacetylase family protein [Oscillospiraceae bacterium]
MFACIGIRARTVLVCALALLLLGTASAMPQAIPVDAKGVAVPIIMYHSVLRDPARAGAYILSPDTVEEDLRYLKQRGYTSLFVCELADAVNKGLPLPERPVILTFDDGYLNNLTYILPLLEQNDMKAVISVVGSYSERFSKQPDHNPAYAHLTWEDISTLADSGRIEIGNHSYDMHRQTPRKGTRKNRGESGASYYEALVRDVGRAQSLLETHCGLVPTTFTYPYGQISDESIPILRGMGFTALLTCYERVNYISGDPDVLFSLGRFNRPAHISTEAFMKKLGIR